MDFGKKWPPPPITPYTTTAICSCAYRPPKRLATGTCGWAPFAVPLLLFLLGPSSLLFFLACGALYALAFLTESFRLLPLCVGANILSTLLQIGPSPTNANPPLVRGVMVVRRGPMVGLEVAHM